MHGPVFTSLTKKYTSNRCIYDLFLVFIILSSIYNWVAQNSIQPGVAVRNQSNRLSETGMNRSLKPLFNHKWSRYKLEDLDLWYQGFLKKQNFQVCYLSFNFNIPYSENDIKYNGINLISTIFHKLWNWTLHMIRKMYDDFTKKCYQLPIQHGLTLTKSVCSMQLLRQLECTYSCQKTKPGITTLILW